MTELPKPEQGAPEILHNVVSQPLSVLEQTEELGEVKVDTVFMHKALKIIEK